MSEHNISDSLYQRLHGLAPQATLSIEVVDNIIEWFENIRIRPKMFFGEANYETVTNGLYWFRMAFRHLAFDTDPKIDVGKERGWESNARGYWHHFQRKGLSEEEMADELIAIEIESWKKLRENILATPSE